MSIKPRTNLFRQVTPRQPIDARSVPGVPKLSYRLQFDDDGVGLPRRVEFEASSAAAALEIAEEQCCGRWALLFCDGAVLCRVGLSAGAWLIAACPASPQPFAG